MSLTPEPAGVAQGAFFPRGKAQRAARRGPLTASRRSRDPFVLTCHVMPRADIFQIRIAPALRDRLARLCHQSGVNPGTWPRAVIEAALGRGLPDGLEAPTRQPLAGCRPCKFGGVWGDVLDGPGMTALAEDPRVAAMRARVE